MVESDMVVEHILLCRAKKNNIRAYLLARCIVGDVKKLKLLVEITQRQSSHYFDIISTILREGQAKVAKGQNYNALKAWARSKRTELLA